MPLALNIDNTTNYFTENQASEAMHQYWNAMQAGKDARLERVDHIPRGGDDDPEPTPPGGVSSLAVERIRRHEQALLQKGIALPPPIYAPGTRVIRTGIDNFRCSRARWEETPQTTDGLRSVVAAVQAEERADFTLNARDLHMGDDGALHFGEGPIFLEEQGLRALVSRNSEVLPRAGELIAAVDPDLRADILNRQLQQVAADKVLKLRTRTGSNGQRQVFAVVSQRYASFDADQVAATLADALEGSEMRGQVVYDARTTSLRADGIYHADKVVDLAAGDVFKVGVQFRSNDAAGGSIVGRALAWRNLCLNLIVIGTGQADLLRRRHIGDVAEVLDDVQVAANTAASVFDDFAQEWGLLREANAADVMGVGTTEEAIAQLSSMPALAVGVKRDALVELLLTGWREEPGETLADVVNAVTRVHALQEIDDYRRERFEEAAGRLVPVLATRVGEA